MIYGIKKSKKNVTDLQEHAFKVYPKRKESDNEKLNKLVRNFYNTISKKMYNKPYNKLDVNKQARVRLLAYRMMEKS